MRATLAGKSAARLGAVLAVAMAPTVAMAADPFACTLREGCGTADCGGDAEITATLAPAPTGWVMTSDGDVAGSFTEIGGTGDTRHFVSTDIDPDADAAALLTIFENGDAYLSLHGLFLDPTAQTFNGRCTVETS